MCDYSLMEFPNRLAVEGEVLVVHRFRSGSLGLASPMDCDRAETKPASQKTFWNRVKNLLVCPDPPVVPAVCIPPGARLIVHDVPVALQKQFAIGPDEDVKFVQMSAAENQHRDAIRFRTGDTLRLQELKVGQRVEVMDLGNEAVDEPNTSGHLETLPVSGGRGW